MTDLTRRDFSLALLGTLAAAPAFAAPRYGPGASDKEIVLGQTQPYSGGASAYGTIGRAEMAYFDMVNANGGINGRKVRLISLDDGYSPPKTVEMVRRLVEQDEVMAVFGLLGTAGNSAVARYLNQQKVPQLLISSGASKWLDTATYPMTMTALPTYDTEASIYAKYVLAQNPNAKIGVLYQNDDLGRDYLKGLHQGLGAAGKKHIAAEVSYEVTDPTVNAQILQLQSSGADVLIVAAVPKFAAQAVRRMGELGWKPLLVLTNIANSIGTVIQPAGPEYAVGAISAAYMKDPTDPTWAKDEGMLRWHAFMDKYYPAGNKTDVFNVTGYYIASFMHRLLEACGDDLTRPGLMRVAESAKDWQFDSLVPGIRISTSPTDHGTIEQMQLMRFDGKRWVLFGNLMST
ncbi:MAG TPA: ABC transporter substrate-binding protein [Quisquiliibacterium sp.]|nr:ABC transporter substrate-binding protein [Quisquiliibacterium sp.]